MWLTGMWLVDLREWLAGLRLWHKCFYVAVLVAFALWVWPTPYTYHTGGGALVRINRVTGARAVVMDSQSTLERARL